MTPDYTLFDQIQTPIFVLEPDATGLPVYAAFNSHARTISRRPLSDYLGHTAREVYAGGQGAVAFEHHCKALKTGRESTYELDLPVLGRMIAVRTTLTPQTGPEGQVLRLFGSSTDITRHRQARDAQQQRNARNAEVEQFVALAAHDLRTPMRNIAHLTEMMREDVVDGGDGKMDLINMMEDVSRKCMTLISDVLSHTQSTVSRAGIMQFNLGVLCADIHAVLDPAHHHILEADPVDLTSDRTAMQLALRNVIDNAFKHGDQRQIRIKVEVEEGPGALITVRMTDNGGGFSAAGLALLNGGRFGVDGGYGLFGVRRMIAARGGTLSAGNCIHSGGAVVTFSLPGRLTSNTCTVVELADRFRPMNWRLEARPQIRH